MMRRPTPAPSPVTEPSADIHIAGVLVHCRPAALADVQRSVAGLERAELFQSSDEGKLVVIVEASSSAGVIETIDAMRELPDVLNVSLVYQHAEPASSLEQEIDP